MINTVCFGTKFKGGQNLLLMLEGFFNKREYSGADWLDLLIYGTKVQDPRPEPLLPPKYGETLGSDAW